MAGPVETDALDDWFLTVLMAVYSLKEHVILNTWVLPHSLYWPLKESEGIDKSGLAIHSVL